jgi:hypothetical protein
MMVLRRDATHGALPVGLVDVHVVHHEATCLLEPTHLAAVWAPQVSSLVVRAHLRGVLRRWWEPYVTAQQGGSFATPDLDLEVELVRTCEVVLEVDALPLAVLLDPQHGPARVGASHAVVHGVHIPPLVRDATIC